MLTVSKIETFRSQISTKSNKSPLWDYNQGTGKQSDTWKSLERFHHFLKLFRISFSGWIDNRNFAVCCTVGRLQERWHLSAFLGGRAIFKPVEGSKILGICCICNQTNIYRRTFPKIYRRVLNEIRISLLQKHFGLQRCIFILFHSRSKSKCLEHWFNPDVLMHVRTNLSPESFLSPNCRWYVELHRELCENSFCTVEKLIFTHHTFGNQRKFPHLCATTDTLAFCDDATTVSQCKVYQGKCL